MSRTSYLTRTMSLPSGHTMPVEGYGTWLTPNNQAAGAVYQALNDGYRLIDTAHVYANERGVGEGLHRAMSDIGLERRDVFITTKIDADVITAEQATASIHESLRKLNVDYVDLILIHAPRPWQYMDEEPQTIDDHYYEKNRVVWRVLEDAVRQGQTRSIGVSQFSIDDMDHLMDTTQIQPALLQTEAYPGNMPHDLMRYCHEHAMVIQAFCPLGHGCILHDPVLERVAAHYETSTAQLCLKYLIQYGFSVIPKSLNPAHITANTHLDFTISDDDMRVLDALDLTHALDNL